MKHVSKEIKELGSALFGAQGPPRKKRKTNEQNDAEESGPKASAWYDPEDDELTVEVGENRKYRTLRKNFDENRLVASEYIGRQRKRFQESTASDWTKPPEEQLSESDFVEDDDDEKKSQISSEGEGAGDKLKSSKRSLKITAMAPDLIPKDMLSFSDLGLVNSRNVHKSIVSVCEFHPNGSVLMTAGFDKTLSLYSLDFHHNELLKQIFVQDLPIRCARFSADGKEIMMSGRRFFLYAFSLDKFQLHRISKLVGRDERSWEYFEYSPNNLHVVFPAPRGTLVVVSTKTKKPIRSFQVNGHIAMIRFSSTGDRMFVLVTTGTMYVYDMRSFRCVDRVMFEGIVKATCFDVMEALNLVAVGCNSGVIGVYRYKMRVSGERSIGLLLDQTEKEEDSDEDADDDGMMKVPLYNVNNLTTTITGVEFNHDGQLMVIWSRIEKESLRVVHVQSGRVFQNWPKQGTMGYVYRAKFSPHSGFLSVANSKGQVRLIRLPFYGNL